MQRYIDPNKVGTVKLRWPYEVRRMKVILEQQGQIEPLIVKPSTDMDYEWVVDLTENHMGDAIVYAARELDWPTILVEDEVITSG